MDITIRRLEPKDYEAMQKLYAFPKVVWGILQPPFPPVVVVHWKALRGARRPFRLA